MSDVLKNETKWLKSPLTEKTERLHPMCDLVLRPYYGAKKKLRLFRTQYTIGRDESCDICLDDPFLSSRHAELRVNKEGDGYCIEDLSSKNGTFLNGVRVQKAPLPSSGVLRLGRSTLAWSNQSIENFSTGDWIVADPFMSETLNRLKVLAKSNISILLLGETGTGKEVLARIMHQWSARASAPYIPINGALTGGNLAESELFGHQKGAYTGSESNRLGALRSANSGTLFLDEVADIPLSTQIKLLRALESGEVKALGSDRAEHADFRLITATSQNLEQKISDGSFRLDLYYRIAGFVVHIPPLRERPKDILAIAQKFIQDRGFDLDKECEGKLLSYSWPGNVRELKATIERAIVLARSESVVRILPSHLSGFEKNFMQKEEQFRPRTLETLERECIQGALERNGWSRSVAAKELGIARSTLFEKMKKFKLQDGATLYQT